jgi:hypothetical protein
MIFLNKIKNILKNIQPYILGGFFVLCITLPLFFFLIQVGKQDGTAEKRTLATMPPYPDLSMRLAVF